MILLYRAVVSRPYSDATAEKMDLEARKMVDSAYQRTLTLVEEKKEQVALFFFSRSFFFFAWRDSGEVLLLCSVGCKYLV